MKIPKGSVKEETTGGPGALKALVEKCREEKLDGYILSNSEEKGATEGCLVFEEGEPIICIYEPGDLLSASALETLIEDSQDPECKLSIHHQVKVKLFKQYYPDATLTAADVESALAGAGAAPAVASSAAAAAAQAAAEAGGGDIATIIHRELAKGLGILTKGEVPEGAEEAICPSCGADVLTTDAKCNSCGVPFIGGDTVADDDSPTISGPPAIPTNLSCKNCGAVLGGDEKVCPSCGVTFTPQDMPDLGEADLLDHLTFDTYVVGESNKFVHAASKKVAETPANAYNPFFVYGDSGLGKTHLLHAIGQAVVTRYPGTRVKYITTENFSNDLIKSIRKGALADFRDRYRTLDVLMVDDIQFLAGEERTQEEFFHTFNSLYDAKKQIIITSDRPPKELDTLVGKLRSRFEGGLIAQIKAPTVEMRQQILRTKAERESIKVDDEVLGLIASNFDSNVRELEGALMRVHAYATLTKTEIDMDSAAQALEISEGGAAPAASAPASTPAPRKEAAAGGGGDPIDVKRGHTYLFKNDKPDGVFSVFVQGVGEGLSGLCISRTNPKRLTGKFELGETRVIWLTDREATSDDMMPPALESMIYVIEEFCTSEENPCLMLDGLEYLISNNGFNPVLNFIRHLVDSISEADAIAFIPVSPFAMAEQEVKMLEREMEVVSPEDESRVFKF